ncbi:MAG: polysaccharide biosynthesis tyrosine autokinase [Proteobacteria bacterium]|nr:polysaccharide biosynthesis tyrosine autokinase [Pseudomonadota bacterium]
MTVQDKQSRAEKISAPRVAPSAGNETLFDVADLLRMVRARQWIILGTTAAVIALTAIVVFRITPLFDATSVVIIEDRQNKAVDVDSIFSGLPTDESSIENQVQILRSRNLMSRVIDKLRLDQASDLAPSAPGFLSLVLHNLNPLRWFGGAVTTKTEAQQEQDRRNAIIDNLLSAETVTRQGVSSAIGITFRSPDPVRAMTVCNAIADAYVEDQLNAKFEATQKATQWLAERLQKLSAQVQATAAAVQEYKADNNINETSTGDSVVGQQLSQLNGQLIIARSDLAEQEAKYARVIELKNSGHADDVSQVVASGLISQLRQQETDLLRQEAEYSSKYGPMHPKMLDLQSQKRNLDAKISEEVQRVVETVANDVAVARARVSSLQGSLAQLEGKSTVESKVRVKLAELESAAASNKSLYEAFLSRFKQAQGQEGIQTPDARTISKAELPDAPSYPKVQTTLIYAIPAGLFLGFLFAMVAERLDTGFRTISQVEALLGIPVLSTLPELRGMDVKEKRAIDRVVDYPMSSFSEGVRGTQMGLALSNVDKRPKVVLVTSSVPGEGKTTAAISLARLAARAGQRVVILDADLRRPSLAETMGLPVGERNTLVQVLSGESALEDSLVCDEKTELRVLTAQKIAGNPPDVLASAAMKTLIARLKDEWDLVLIDTAPLLPVNDTKMLLGLADAVLFVVRWEKTPREAALQAGRILSDYRAFVAGIVLSRTDTTRYGYYNYGYQGYSNYNEYYSD